MHPDFTDIKIWPNISFRIYEIKHRSAIDRNPGLLIPSLCFFYNGILFHSFNKDISKIIPLGHSCKYRFFYSNAKTLNFKPLMRSYLENIFFKWFLDQKEHKQMPKFCGYGIQDKHFKKQEKLEIQSGGGWWHQVKGNWEATKKIICQLDFSPGCPWLL